MTAAQNTDIKAGASGFRDPDPLPDFDRAVESLADRHEKLVVELSRTNSVRPLATFRLGVTGQDVLASAALLRETQRVEVERWLDDERLAALDPSPSRRIVEELGPKVDLGTVNTRLREAMTPEVTAAMERFFAEMNARMPKGVAAYRRFGVVYKAFFYFVRVYQDAIYVVLNNLLGECTARGSMSKALGERNPVRALLEHDTPGYLEWFAVWRDQRNRWKDGADYHIAGPAPNLGIGFSRYDEATKGVVADLAGEIVRLPDATAAVRESCRAVETALTLATSTAAEKGP